MAYLPSISANETLTASEFPIVWNPSIDLNTIISIIVLIGSLITLYLVYKFRQEFSFPEQIANVPDFLCNDYKHRKFSFQRKEESIGEVRNRLKQLRKELKKNPDGMLNHRDAELEIEFSFEVSRALQNVGLLTLFGAIPIELVLPDNAIVIVEDWTLCKKVVNDILRTGEQNEQEAKLVSKKKVTDLPIHFSRRHAEWLFCASAVYLSNCWEGKRVESVLKPIGEIQEIKKREQELRESEPHISKRTSAEIKKFLYQS